MTVLFQARPPGIYKAHYLKELAVRYNAGNMVDFVVPERPSWCDEDDKEDDYEVTTCGTNPVRKGGTKRGGEFQNEVMSSSLNQFNMNCVDINV